MPSRQKIGREAKTLLTKSLDSLSVAVELFNRPHDRGRACSVIILLDHSFEMLLKAALVHRKVNIQDNASSYMMGFEKCLNKAFSECVPPIINADQKRSISLINSVRDAFQHYIIEVDEVQLHLHIQSGTTVFRMILNDVFDVDLADSMPRRVLPITTIAMPDIQVYFDRKITEIQSLLAPGRRRSHEAMSQLRSIVILNRALQDEDGAPTIRDLKRIGKSIRSGTDWRSVFSGVASMQTVQTGEGHRLSLRITKQEGIPMHHANAGDMKQTSVAYREINKLDKYSLYPKTMAEHLDIPLNHFNAVSRYLELEKNEDWFWLARLGSQRQKRFTQACLLHVKTELSALTPDERNAVIKQHLPRGPRKARMNVV